MDELITKLENGIKDFESKSDDWTLDKTQVCNALLALNIDATKAGRVDMMDILGKMACAALVIPGNNTWDKTDMITIYANVLELAKKDDAYTKAIEEMFERKD